MSHLITQDEADYFFSMEKFPEEQKEYQFPSQGDKLIIPFTSADKHEGFLFDIYRGAIKISKLTYQNRVRKAYILRRLDLDSSAHLNPEVENVPLPLLEPYNGKEIATPHLHIYVEGFGEKWAVPADLYLSIAGKDSYEIMEEFFQYCNVKTMPRILKTIFI